jgi:aarF domain-containing kinase
LKTNAKVVLKYQYPEVETLFKEDLKTVAFFCKMLQPEMSPMMEEMERQFLTEFDFAREGWGNCCACVVCAFFLKSFVLLALEEIGEAVRKKFGEKNVHIPRPYRSLCYRRVCVMERLEGEKVRFNVVAKFCF